MHWRHQMFQCRPFSVVTSRLRYDTPIQSSYKKVMSGISSQAMILLVSTSKAERGMTLSSATSLSVSPTPLIQFNLQVPSSTSSILHEAKHFSLNILPPTERSVDLCRLFASGEKGINEAKLDGFDPFQTDVKFRARSSMDKLEEHHKNHENIVVSPEQFDEWDKAEISTLKEHHIPTIRSAVDVLYCEKLNVFRVHDHEIWIGKVLGIEHRATPKGGVLFHNHRFHQVGSPIGNSGDVREVCDVAEDAAAGDMEGKDEIKSGE